jgi:hypothetical protein
MKIEQIATDKLIPYARNAKKHDAAQVSKLAGSIREFGFNNPVLIDKDNGIIAGHGRVMAAQSLSLNTVPCIRLGHLTDTQRRAYILADNRLAEMGGGWDEEMLKLELAELGDLDVDLGLLGFDTEGTEEEIGPHDVFNVESDIERTTGKGPYHIKDVCIGAFALKSSSTVPNYKEMIAKKKTDPDAFAAILKADFIEFFLRGGPTKPPITYITTPFTTNQNHPMYTVADAVADHLGVKRIDLFISQKRKTRGVHAEESQQTLSRMIDKGSGILIIDDVVTTGRTMRRCVDEIHKAGSFAFPFAWICYQ